MDLFTTNTASVAVLLLILWRFQRTAVGMTLSYGLPYHGSENQCTAIAGCVACQSLTLEGAFWERDVFRTCDVNCESIKWTSAGYGYCQTTSEWELCGLSRFVNNKCTCEKNVTTRVCNQCHSGYLLQDGLCLKDGIYKLHDSFHRDVINYSLPFRGDGMSCDHVPGCNRCSTGVINGSFWELDALGSCNADCTDRVWGELGYGRCRGTGEWSWYGFQYNELCRCEKTVQTGRCTRCEQGLLLSGGLCFDRSRAVVNGNGRICPESSSRNRRGDRLKCNGLMRLCNRRVHEIAWAGTHNAGSYNLHFIDDLGNPEHDVGWCKELPWWSDIVPKGDNILARISENQDYDVTRQLWDGIRYLDVDLCEEYSGTLKTCHCMWGERIAEILLKIRRWLGDRRNRNEVIILAFGDGMRNARRMAKLADLVEGILGYYLAPKTSWNRTLRDLIVCQQRVFVLWGSEQHENARWWTVSKETMETGSFSRTSSPEVMTGDQTRKLASKRGGKLHTVSWILTPDSTLIATVLAGPILGSLGIKIYANIVNVELAGVFERSADFRNNTNVLLVDYYQIGSVIEVVKTLNNART
ncbi:uncharacterized protein LOC141911402 [Tubulanus polymorphus]|uniref:uncharacterized protein LOC141911402 n=1 Tax=Tubulanus polymorphus TaxID=672921 RepID=UPI003DA26D18